MFFTRPQHFFSYSETDREVSLILDETHIPAFPKDTLDVCNVIWRAVQIEAGESGLGKIFLLSSISFRDTLSTWLGGGKGKGQRELDIGVVAQSKQQRPKPIAIYKQTHTDEAYGSLALPTDTGPGLDTLSWGALY